ncbi:hypothetical protein KUCAC02_000935 [Chaenocephalus aceratus]|uniref:Uncharacterized protein n=1 Tax=Chaenocephalus aceratus TaxID=36190 RepID=A0ACB9XUW0_CHAAC|nr:hypothetical protein KUCAC02_000935 [Chaenocephalus aceratus]
MLFSVGLSLVVLLSVVGAATVERVEYDYYKIPSNARDHRLMVQAVKDYPEVVTIVEYGQTYEKRTISLLKIGVNTGEQKKAIWMDCGIHAREWIAPAFCRTLSKRSFKTTQLDCGGRTDLNRNFNANWGTARVSFECCDNTFCGIKPVSEPEAQAVTYFVGNRKEDFLCFLTIHSYSKMLLVPFGHPNFIASNYDELKKVGRGAADAIRSVHGKDYTVGTSPDVMYANSGSSQDWARMQGIPLTYTFELRDDGTFGFELPQDQIQPTCEEAYSGALHIITYAHDKTFSGATATAATLWSMLLALGVTGTTLM